MPRTGQHGYFNISNSNYKSLMDPGRLVEITGWNRVSTTQSAVIDQHQHQPREENKPTPQNCNITLSNLKITEGVYSRVETGGPGTEQSNPGSEPATQWFRGSAQSIPHLPALVISKESALFSQFRYLVKSRKKALPPPGFVHYSEG